MTKIGVVVPELRLEGGVKNAARFILDAIEEFPGVHVELASLAMSSSDEASTRLLSPRTWRKPIGSMFISAWGRQIQHYGAEFVELELMRFRSRPLLAEFTQRQDLIVVIAGSPSWALPFVGLGVPVILTAATLTNLERSTSFSITPRQISRAIFRRYLGSLDDEALRNADHVVVLNRLMEKYVSELRGGKELTYAPLAVDTDVFRPAPTAGDYILFVGRFSDPRKNVEQLLRAYRLLRSKHNLNIPIKFAGTGELVLGELEGDPSVEVVQKPSTAELVELYRHAFVFVLPSREEGFGLVVAEAMASGTPVVSTRCGGPEDLVDHGVDGYLVGVDDDEKMADSIAELRLNPDVRKAMSIKAREKMRNQFSLDAAKKNHQKIYQRFIQGRIDALVSRAGEQIR